MTATSAIAPHACHMPWKKRYSQRFRGRAIATERPLTSQQSAESTDASESSRFVGEFELHTTAEISPAVPTERSAMRTRRISWSCSRPLIASAHTLSAATKQNQQHSRWKPKRCHAAALHR